MAKAKRSAASPPAGGSSLSRSNFFTRHDNVALYVPNLIGELVEIGVEKEEERREKRGTSLSFSPFSTNSTLSPSRLHPRRLRRVRLLRRADQSGPVHGVLLFQVREVLTAEIEEEEQKKKERKHSSL